MNANTKKDLQEFIYAVELLAQCCIHMTGTDNATKIMVSCEKLKEQLDKDETILD